MLFSRKYLNKKKLIFLKNRKLILELELMSELEFKTKYKSLKNKIYKPNTKIILLLLQSTDLVFKYLINLFLNNKLILDKIHQF